MKLSVYNTYINCADNLGCIYNALTDKTLVFMGNAVKIGKGESIPHYLYDKFTLAGILVEDDKDECAEYVSAAKEAEDDGKSFHIIINPTLNCNFHCHYCYESHVPSKMGPDVMSATKSS